MPLESTRILPSLGLLATSTVALPPPLADAGVPDALALAGLVDEELLLLPPQPAIARRAITPRENAKLTRAFTGVPLSVSGESGESAGGVGPLSASTPGYGRRAG